MNKDRITFQIINYHHAGDIIFTRIFLKELLKTYPDVNVVAECPGRYGYLLSDLNVKIIPVVEDAPVSYFLSPGLYFFNLHFMAKREIYDNYGISYNTMVYTFNAFLKDYGLYERYKMPILRYPVFNEFPVQTHVPRAKPRAVLVENGPVFSKQSNMDLNEYLPEFAEKHPGLNFYCSASPGFCAANVFDISAMNLVEISELSNSCVAFLTRCSGVNAASMTEKNKYKPRCFAGAGDILFTTWLFDLPENQALMLSEKEDVADFLEMIDRSGDVLPFVTRDTELNPGKHRVVLESYLTGVSFCRFLKNHDEVKKCSEYLRACMIKPHITEYKNWELAHILNDLTDGNLLDINNTFSGLLNGALYKGIDGEKYDITPVLPAVKLPMINYLAGEFCDGVDLPGGFFRNITCLTILTRNTDMKKFAAEASRLLCPQGKLYVSLNYRDREGDFDPAVLSKPHVLNLIDECRVSGLRLSHEVDWGLGEAVVDGICTYGLFKFIKG